MAERWRRELRKLDGLEPPDGVVQEAGHGPRLPAAGPGVGSRVMAAVVAFVVFVTAGTWAWRAFRADEKVDRPPQPLVATYPPAPDSGYYFLFPDELEVATDDPNGGVRLVVRTNLPDGTILAINDETFGVDPGADPQSSGSSCCPKVKDGQITVVVNNGSCYNLVGSTGNSWGFDLTLTAAPEPPDMSMGGGGTFSPDGAKPYEPPRQPQTVLDVLGAHFERLTGDQVVPAGKDLTLVGTLRRPWPADSCAGTRAGFIPDRCPATQEQIQGDHLVAAMGEVMGQIGQARLCELWQSSLTLEAEAAHPWPEFRAEWERWLYDPPKDFTPGDSGVDSELTWHVVAEEGDRSTIDLVLRGERIAQLVVTALPYWPGSDRKGVVPFWGVEEYSLLVGAAVSPSSPSP